MNRTLYTLLFCLAMPLIFARLLWRSIKAPAYRLRWAERLGFYKATITVQRPSNVIFHAVSVGEVHVAVPLIKKIQREFPELGIIITTSTPTGSRRVTALFGNSVAHVYLPYDLPSATRRFLNFAQADLLIILETELWPNLLFACRQRGMKVMLANARLSEKSFNSYQKITRLAQQMMASISVVAAQSKVDGERFIELGLLPSALQITGSMKFDFEINKDQVLDAHSLKQRWKERPVLIAGSTRDKEEEKVLQGFQEMLKSCPELLLVLVPRHPERFSSVFKQAQSKELRVVTRSSAQTISDDVQVLLGDSMGEMSFYYGLADLAFVGGSLVNTGCQNIIEPAAMGLPVITGPSLFNFKSVSQILIKSGGMKVVEDAQAFSTIILSLLNNRDALAEMSRKIKSAVEVNRGATSRLMTLTKQLIKPYN